LKRKIRKLKDVILTLNEMQNSVRLIFIRQIQTLAVKHGRCQEQVDGKCMYPHCNCLFGENGPIDPVTGKEIEQ